MASAAAHERRLQVLFVSGQRIQVDAQISITTGAVSGAGHVASSPGEPPNADTHGLDSQIETTREAGEQIHVTSNAPYSAALEFGTSKMVERPFMRPALEKNRESITRTLADLQARISRG